MDPHLFLTSVSAVNSLQPIFLAKYTYTKSYTVNFVESVIFNISLRSSQPTSSIIKLMEHDLPSPYISL